MNNLFHDGQNPDMHITFASAKSSDFLIKTNGIMFVGLITLLL